MEALHVTEYPTTPQQPGAEPRQAVRPDEGSIPHARAQAPSAPEDGGVRQPSRPTAEPAEATAPRADPTGPRADAAGDLTGPRPGAPGPSDVPAGASAPASPHAPATEPPK
ncbi:hypothetical protein GL263_20610, partial [Streptomyces durbertensis]|nr:hypothetical protein [Streptomyces durbertensis]